MKKIECIIPDKKFKDLELALRRFGVSGMTVSQVKGFGNEQSRPESYLYLPKTKVELFCNDHEVDDLVEVICQSCESDQLGAGKVAVFDMEDLVRVRTKERGMVAV